MVEVIFKIRDLLLISVCLYGLVYKGHGKKFDPFKDLLRKHALEENSIDILIRNGIISANILKVMDKDDIKELGLNVGQTVLLKKLVKKLKTSDEEEDYHRDEHTSQFKTTEMPRKTSLSFREVDVLLKNMKTDNFWCLFRCLGGFGAASLAGIAALVALAIPLGVPVFGFRAAWIAAVPAAGVSFATILTIDVVRKAVQGACSHCFE